MKARKVTPAAIDALAAISSFIAADNPVNADRYYRAAIDAFFGHPEELTPKRASDALPKFVRSMRVPGFNGYTLRIAVLEDEIYLIAALRPGLTDDMKDDQTRPGLGDIPSEG